MFLPAVWMVPSTLIIVIVAGIVCVGFLFIAVTVPRMAAIAWPMLPLPALFAAYSVDRIARRYRETRSVVVLTYVDNAMRLNLPLPAFLGAAQESERGGTRRLLSRVRSSLTAGYSVHAALAEALPDMPEGILRTLAAAEPLGQTRQALSRMLENQRRSGKLEREKRLPFYRFYPIGLAVVIMALTIYVMPKIKEVLKDFRVDPPASTKVLLNLTGTLSESGVVVLLLALLWLAIYWPLSLYLHRIILPGWRLPSVGGIMEVVKWCLPVVHGMERDRSMAQTAAFLEEALRAGVPLTRAVERSLLLPTNVFVRKRLRKWLDYLEAGALPAEGARKAGLPGLLAGLLGPGSDDLALADMFGFLASYYKQRFSRGLVMLRAASEPVIVLFFGAVVFAVCLSIVQPMVTIIQKELSYYPGYF